MRPSYNIPVNVRAANVGSSLSLVQWDHLSSDIFLLLKDGETPFNLTGCTVEIGLIKADGEYYVLSDLVTITDVALGTVKVLLTSLDLCVPGYSFFEIKIMQASTVLTTNKVGFEIRRSSQLTGEKSIPPLKQIEGSLVVLTEECQAIKAEEVIRKSAETSRVSAEAGRVSAEGQRVAAETVRSENETARGQNESIRQAAESTRSSKESERLAAENDRKSSETTRGQAEETRASQETTRNNQESIRQSNETTRANNEATRISQETGRMDAEAARVLVESGRAEAESQRLTKESERLAAELERVSAESGRNSAEANRVAAELSRTTQFNDILTAYQASIASQTNVEVTAARNSAKQGKLFTSLDERLESIEADVFGQSPGITTMNAPNSVKNITDCYSGMIDAEIGGNTAINLSKNGNFAQGTTGWIAPSGTHAVVDGVSEYTVVTVSGSARIERNVDDAVIGARYYLSGDILPLINNNTYIQYGGASHSIPTLIPNVWNKVSGIVTAVDNQRLRFYHGTTGYSVGQIIKRRFVDAIRLDTNPYVLAYEATVGRQITKDEADKMFANYFEGMKSTTEVTVKTTLKNLFDLLGKPFSTTRVSVQPGTDSLTVSSATSGTYNNVTYRLVLLPNTQYTMSIGSATGSSSLASIFATTGHTYITGISNSTKVRTFTTPADGSIDIEFYATGGTSESLTAVFNQIQLERGPIATNFEPFNESKFNVKCTDPTKFALHLLPNVVKNEVNLSKGYLSAVKRIRGELILNGSESWIEYTGTNVRNNQIRGFQLLNALPGFIKHVAPPAYADNIPTIQYCWDTANSLAFSGHPTSQTAYIVIETSKLTTQDPAGFKAWLAANPIKVYYQLETPEFIAFEDFNKHGIVVTGDINATKGNTTISVESPDLLPDIKITYPMNVLQAINNEKESSEFIKQMIQRHETRIDQCDAKNVVDGFGTAAPTTGTYIVGQKIWNTVPVPGGFLGWVCTVAGTPGTWKGFGQIQA